MYINYKLGFNKGIIYTLWLDIKVNYLFLIINFLFIYLYKLFIIASLCDSETWKLSQADILTINSWYYIAV